MKCVTNVKISKINAKSTLELMWKKCQNLDGVKYVGQKNSDTMKQEPVDRRKVY